MGQVLIINAGGQVHGDSLNYSLYFCVFLKFPRINVFFVVVQGSTINTDYFSNLLPLLKNHQSFNTHGRLTVTSHLSVRLSLVLWGLPHLLQHQNQQAWLLGKAKHLWDLPRCYGVKRVTCGTLEYGILNELAK